MRFLSLTAVSAELNVVDEAIQRILAGWIVSARTTSALDLGAIYDVEPPSGGAHPYKLVVFAPTASPASSIIVTNLRDGWASLSHAVAREVGAPQMQIISTGRGAAYPQHLFQCWRDGTARRIVMAMRDSERWEFFEHGEVEPFEDAGLYLQRLKRCRLTRETLVSYLLQLGWDVTSERFWHSERDAVYFKQSRKRVPAPF